MGVGGGIDDDDDDGPAVGDDGQWCERLHNHNRTYSIGVSFPEDSVVEAHDDRGSIFLL